MTRGGLRVSIHAPTRGATKGKQLCKLAFTFQSTRPHGARLIRPGVVTSRLPFQSTRPHGARRATPTASMRPWTFQSTRPHGARRQPLRPRRHRRQVSIHAPTRGATLMGGTAQYIANVSIHAPTRGATASARHPSPSHMFQSTRPHGARPQRPSSLARARSFNPRAHTGRDARSFFSWRSFLMFQSTRPHGARLRRVFGFHLHEGVSIHAPTRGATGALLQLASGWAGFNPRAHTGRDGSR